MDHLSIQTASGFRALSATLLLLSACGEDPTGPDPDAPGLFIFAQPPVSDTVTAAPVQAIVVQLRDSSRQLVEGATVRFTGLPAVPGTLSSMLVRSASGIFYAPFAAITSNAQGRASAQIQYGTVAGPGLIEIAVEELGIVDTLTFTILPGNLASLAITPGDTAIHVGASFTLSAHPQDRLGNNRSGSGTVTWEILTSPGGGALINAAGVFTASAISRARVIASSGTTRDSAFVSVVPPGTYVAFEPASGNLVYGDLDGSARRVFRAGPFRDAIEPAWSPAGDEVAVAPFIPNQVQFVSLAGGLSSVTWTVNFGDADAYWPAYSRDGQFLYFSGVVGSANGIFRIRRQGGDAETIGPCECYRPSVSPDGRQVVFHFVTNDVVVRVWDIAAQAYVSPEVPGRFAEWSPIGNEIVFHENETGRIKIMASNGTNVRYLTPVGRVYSQNSQISWSSAGTWILARSAASVDLINVATGLILPLSASSTLINPALRP